MALGHAVCAAIPSLATLIAREIAREIVDNPTWRIGLHPPGLGVDKLDPRTEHRRLVSICILATP